MSTVSVSRVKEFTYPKLPPYHPAENYPELARFSQIARSDEQNVVYEGLREIFRLQGYDADRAGTQSWNPLGWLVKPGETVFLKPNMIAEKHKLRPDWDYVITHGSLVRAVIDYVYIALEGKGRIIIGDSPQTDSDFGKIAEHMGLQEMKDHYSRTFGFDIEVIDLRDEFWVEKDGVHLQTIKLSGDPRGKVLFDLGPNSMFAELDPRGKRYYGAFYDVEETNRHHANGKHEYSISRSAVEADVFINIPKLKTHKKCGLTVNLKGLVGINADKNLLPHYAFGSPTTGGDQFDREDAATKLENSMVQFAKQVLLRRNPLAQRVARSAKKLAYRVFGDTEKVIRSGNWHGNDTVWRMCLDLNRILFYGLPNGSLDPARPKKKYFSLVDGIVAMEGNGPVAGDRKEAGLLIAGENPVAVDLVCAKIMGFDYRKTPLLLHAADPHAFALFDQAPERITVASNVSAWNKSLGGWQRGDNLKFKPHFGWAGHIEEEH